jgi:4'-phosphopantetheinyl transferase
MPPPGHGDVHLWWVDLARGQVAASLLSPIERERAGRLRREDDRRRWIAARTALRQILSGYIGRPPRDVPLVVGAYGKPALAGGTPHFNLSHAGERALLAVALCEVGVDLEPAAADSVTLADLNRLMARVCTVEEAARVRALPVAEQQRAFLRLWVMKEAYVKGIGVGLGWEPGGDWGEGLLGGGAETEDQFVFGESPDWTIRLFDAGPSWVAALAVRELEIRICAREWPADKAGPG